MPDQLINITGFERNPNQVRLRTLIVLRWIAIVGQLGAITVAQYAFGITLEIGPVYLVIGVSMVANLLAMFLFPENRRLSEVEIAGMLLFDIAQLSLLLFLTGGLSNPFALLILAPVTISATALGMRSTVFLGASAIGLISTVALVHLPLRLASGNVLAMPETFEFGFWVAIVTGIVFLASYASKVTSEIQSMSEALLATQMALDREQKLTDLGGVVAAAAHELGTPLATIKLVSSELMEELTDNPDLHDDAALIRAQADRCRDILRSMGQAGKDDKHLRHALLNAMIDEAAAPHRDRGRKIVIEAGQEDGAATPQPVVLRQPEVIHGLRNMIQNAVDFAESTVWIDTSWSDLRITIRILDDGPGFPPHLIGRIGDPFVRQRRADSREQGGVRPGYEGMGLGLFIAKTLLERSGAELTFANASGPESRKAQAGEPKGAIVEVSWPLGAIAASHHADRAALGANDPIRI